jgi:hypothetical protein
MARLAGAARRLGSILRAYYAKGRSLRRVHWWLVVANRSRLPDPAVIGDYSIDRYSKNG